ncbi:MAG: class I SAM-dependent methyltransferase [Proteobacteria bacterium]|nr:class I SAM-dependent methyltransferase [Pseudomonadota bacterium]
MSEHVCPWWLGYLLANPIRKLFANPEKILAPYVKPGMKILEVGPGMGFFTIPMAKMLNGKGKIYAVDLQEKMLSVLNKKLRKKGLSERVETRLCSSDSLNIQDLNNQIDLTILFCVVHEIPDKAHFFQQINKAMKPGGKIFIVEPKGHVSKKDFEEMLKLLGDMSLEVERNPKIFNSYTVVMIVKNA